MSTTGTATAASAGRVFFYVQHLLGIGHLARASRIAGALKDAGLDVTLVTGGSAVDGFPGAGIAHVALPPIVASNSGFSGLADLHGNPIDERFKRDRTERLLQAYRTARPDVVIVEAFPFGRRPVRFELLPLIDAIENTRPRPLLFSSIRDILQQNRKPGRDQETSDLVRAHFDAVLVHGDPSFGRLEDTYPLASQIADRVHYTGLVAAPLPTPAPDRFDTVISAGGGAVGVELIAAALDARAILGDMSPWCVITGPNMPKADYDRFVERTAGSPVKLFRFRSDFPNLLPNAELSISQAGYNTVCDLLRANCRALLVPFSAGGETEQSVRAEKLAALGFARIIPDEGLTGNGMAKAITAARTLTLPQQFTVSLEGAAETARLILERLAGRG
ncbi:glycosyl transferase [Rhizobium sp. CG5]|uniref:glycosyltransferase family protein n=1 Tax=Rhizobium sp. CG5 TaxID=2726076 RepID=UPI002033461A|nr:glycosyltransferase [Rhizobium sp. CG5]MCM2475468.1 glycosyl transferase [Rhizobium sp. CG5]